MKKILFAAFPAVMAGLLFTSPVGDPLPIGAAVPHAEKKMKDINGKEISFKDAMKKNGLLVMFSCNTCPVVVKYESRTVDATKAALSNDIGVILLNSNEAYRDNGDSYDDMKAYAKKLGYNFYYVVDNQSAMADAFGANRTPECFLFDKDGKLVYHGAIDDNANAPTDAQPYLKTAMTRLVKGEKIDPEKTKSIGCTIKRQS
jgi:thioredoxin-related protein